MGGRRTLGKKKYSGIIKRSCLLVGEVGTPSLVIRTFTRGEKLYFFLTNTTTYIRTQHTHTHTHKVSIKLIIIFHYGVRVSLLFRRTSGGGQSTLDLKIRKPMIKQIYYIQ